MNGKAYFQKPMLFLALIAMLISAVGCSPVAAVAPVEAETEQESRPVETELEPGQGEPADPAQAPDPATPEGVAVLFFAEYIGWDPFGRVEPVQSGLRGEQYLSAEYVRQVQEIRRGFDGSGFDPILKAQDFPPGPPKVKHSEVEGDQAQVDIVFGADTVYWQRTVDLERIDGQWLIVPDRVEGGALTPEETVAAFYTWYLEYIGSGEDFRNPLADRAYQSAPYLHDALVRQVDELGAGPDGFHFDPFLCAQDVPQALDAETGFYNNARPVVLVGSDFPGHTLTAELVRVDFNQWAIRSITCGSSPHGAVKGFYTWALGYMTQASDFRNPWVDGAYHASPFLSESFVAELDRLLASSEPLVADPVLLAQDLPQAFDTEPCPEGACVLANFHYGDTMVRQLRIELDAGQYPPRIIAIHHAEGPVSPQPAKPVAGIEHWIQLTDEQYGFSFRYPAGWQPSGLSVTSLHTPEEYPVMRSILLQQPSAASSMVSLLVEVVVGDEETLTTSYPLQELIEETEINGIPARIIKTDPGILHAIFQHPTKADVWIILTDTVSQFPGREDLAQAMEGVFDAVLSTIAFSR